MCDNSNRLVVCTSNKSNGSHTGNLTYFMIVWWGEVGEGGERGEKGRGERGEGKGREGRSAGISI